MFKHLSSTRFAGFPRTRATICCLLGVLLLGATLRLAFPGSIEFKHDETESLWYIEKYQSGEIGVPLLGQPSSSGLRHPALGAWFFMGFGVLFDVQTPIGLSRIVQVFSIIALVALLIFAWRLPESYRYREAWIWCFILSAVNPHQVLLERKAWHPSLLPFFVLLLWVGWWARERSRAAAFTWGMMGLWVGQLHIGGFFFTIGLFFWTLAFDLKRVEIKWRWWLLGNAMGVITMLPWLYWMFFDRDGGDMNMKPHRWLMPKYFAYWFRNAFGWNSKYPFGQDVWDFYSRPYSTYFVGVVHLLLVFLAGYAIFLLLKMLKAWWKEREAKVAKPQDDTIFLLKAACLGTGIFATLSAINITRYFHLNVYPLPALFLAVLFLTHARGARKFLTLLFSLQLILTMSLLLYISTRELRIKGDFGNPYFQQISVP